MSNLIAIASLISEIWLATDRQTETHTQTHTHIYRHSLVRLSKQNPTHDKKQPGSSSLQLSRGLAGHAAIEHSVNIMQTGLQTLHKLGGVLVRLVGGHVEAHSMLLDGITWTRTHKKWKQD